jgi:hypothetical protein
MRDGSIRWDGSELSDIEPLLTIETHKPAAEDRYVDKKSFYHHKPWTIGEIHLHHGRICFAIVSDWEMSLPTSRPLANNADFILLKA